MRSSDSLATLVVCPLSHILDSLPPPTPESLHMSPVTGSERKEWFMGVGTGRLVSQGSGG